VLLSCQGDHAEYFKEVFGSDDEGEESGVEDKEKEDDQGENVKEPPVNPSESTPRP
jgi:hypothetical protein